MKVKELLARAIALSLALFVSCKDEPSTPPLVSEAPIVTISADKQDVTAPAEVTLTATVSNYESGISYQWYEAADKEGNDGKPIEGGTESSYRISYPENTSKTFYYYCVATVSNIDGKSNRVEITVKEAVGDLDVTIQ